jgi:hypothetical protein
MNRNDARPHPCLLPLEKEADGQRAYSRQYLRRDSRFGSLTGHRSANDPTYLLGSYRIATAPEPNSSRLTSFKSICFDSPANNVGPWPASLGCTTNS